jgi:hypothetical protein
MEMHDHITSRLKANEFGIAQSSQNRRRSRFNIDDLNEKEKWKRGASTNSKRRGRYFSKEKNPRTARNDRHRAP